MSIFAEQIRMCEIIIGKLNQVDLTRPERDFVIWAMSFATGSAIAHERMSKEPTVEFGGDDVFESWYLLLLNDMRDSNIESIQPRFRAKTEADLIAFLAREKVPVYTDGRWGKVFRQGSPLEWYNDPDPWRTHIMTARTVPNDWGSNVLMTKQHLEQIPVVPALDVQTG